MADAKSRTDNAVPTDAAVYHRWVEERVRFNDVDMQGHVNNTIIASYFEAGRLAINRLGECPVEAGKGLVVAQVTIRYLAPIYWPSVMRIGTRVAAVSERSCTMQQVIFVGEQCVASCEVVIVSIDLASGKPVPHGQARKAYLETLR